MSQPITPGDVAGDVNLAFDGADAVVNLERVGAAGPAAVGNNFDLAYIINDVFDPATNTIRFVEVYI